MDALHDRALRALRMALQARGDALLRTLETLFDERSLLAALQARRQLAELRALARFLDERPLQRACAELQRGLLALGRQVLQGVPEAQSRPVLRQALQIRSYLGCLTHPLPQRQTRDQRAAQLAPDLHRVLLQRVRQRLSRHAGLAPVPEDGGWQALRAAAQLADVLPDGVLVSGDELAALLRWEQHLQGGTLSPAARLLQQIAVRLQALCDEWGASAVLRSGLDTRFGPLSERILRLLQQAVVLLPGFTHAGPALRRTLQQSLRLARLLHSWQSVPSLTATSLPAAAGPLLLRRLLRLQDDVARAASGSTVACAGLAPAALEEAVRDCLRRQRPVSARQLLADMLGLPAARDATALAAMQALAEQERATAVQWLQTWHDTCAGQPGPHQLPDAADLALARLSQWALVTGELKLHELLSVLGQCFTLSRELQNDARGALRWLAGVLPFLADPSLCWQRPRALLCLLRAEARLRVCSTAGAAEVALMLARGLRALPGLQVPAFLRQEDAADVFAASNRQVLMELRMLASGARVLQVQRIAALSAALARVHEALAQTPQAPSQWLADTGGQMLLEQGHAALRRGLNQAAARQETRECRALLGALYDWLARHGEQAAGRAGFVQEAQSLMQQIADAASDRQRLHALHTLKGNAALYRCDLLVELCHRSERELLQSGLHEPRPADAGVREPAALTPVLQQLQHAVAVLAGQAPVGAPPVRADSLVADPARQPADALTGQGLPAPDCRLLSTRLRSGLQALFDVLQATDEAPDPFRQQLARELLQEQLAQAIELEEDLAATPQIHFMRLAPRLRRVLEDIAHRQGKLVHLEVQAAGRRVDRAMLASLVAPLEHLLRNAVVHGIEPPDRRRARGKPECGRVRVLLEGSDGQLQLGVEDDGQGLAAVPLQFEAGCTLRLDADADAGHGLGLAAVQAGVTALGGRVRVSSWPGQGTCFWLQMPENSGLGDNHAMPL